MKPKILVVGSANTDMIVKTDRIPQPGETVVGGYFSTAQGGKGANQAVAAARLGAEVVFIARVGQDSLGEANLAAYLREGIDVRHVIRDADSPSGVAMIIVSQDGENSIAVASGANARLTPEDIQTAEEAFQSADLILVQLETPLETVAAVVRMARQYHRRVILNPAPAPAGKLPPDLLKGVYVLTPNEKEAAALAGNFDSLLDQEGGVAISRRLGVDRLVITLGANGALVVEEDTQTMIPPFKVVAVDSTGAGDAFNGALAVAMARGKSLAAAARDASAVAAISVTRLGAQPSLPTVSDVEQFLAAAS